MSDTYWSRFLNARLSRRRTLVAATGASAGAVLLAACGRGSDDGALKDTSGLLSVPTDTTKQAVRGGIYQSFVNAEAPTYDVAARSELQTFIQGNHAYQRFFRFTPATYANPTGGGEIEGDAVESWEWSPDRTQLTLRLRANNRLDPRPPTSGRVLDTRDVKWSWDRFSSQHPRRSVFLNSVSPDSPVASMSYPDARTVVIRLAYPYPTLPYMFGAIFFFAIMPFEAEDKFDPRTEMRGSGAWMLTKHEPSAGIAYQRNPGWFMAAERPFFDGIDYPLISEPAAQQAQFLAKRVWNLPAPNQDLVLSMKREAREALLLPTSPFQGNTSQIYIGMSKKPDSPFEKDIRIKHAISLLIDRDAYVDAVNNVSGFRKEGLPVEYGINSHVPCSWPRVWLDPRSKEFGPNAKYFEHNPDEAAKLLRAAGAFGLETTFNLSNNPVFGLQRHLEMLAQMWSAGGHFKVNVVTHDHNTFYTPRIHFAKGQYDGLATHPLGGWPHWDIALWNTFTPSGGNDYVAYDIPELKNLMVKHRQEADPRKQIEIAHEWQRAIAYHMPIVPSAGIATTFSLAWPWLGNAGWHYVTGGGVAAQETVIHLWYDKSKDTRPA